MRTTLLVALSIPLLPLAACVQAEPVTTYTPYPKMVLSQGTLEFGTLEWGETSERTVVLSNEGFNWADGVYSGMNMGVGTPPSDPDQPCGSWNAMTGYSEGKDCNGPGIQIGKGMDSSFSIAYDINDITCPEGVAESDAEETSADAKARDSGSSGGNQDSGSGGGSSTDDSAGGESSLSDGETFVLGPDCSIPVTLTYAPASVGEVWGSIYVESVQASQTEEEKAAGDIPAFVRDPIHSQQLVYLHGEAEKGEGTVVVTPRSFDYGYVYPSATAQDEVARVSISNVGTGDLTLGEALLDSTCGTAYSIVSSFTTNAVLVSGASTLVEVAFNPTDDAPAYCGLSITSNDAVNSTLKVTLKANSGADPENVPPTVAIRSPSPGYEYNSPNGLQLELNIFDKNQPATSLTCKVKSLLTSSTIADCSAIDESGHVVVDIPRESFDSGIDTLTVTVTDAESISVTDAVSVLINTAYPDSDDDGDGYGVESDPPDCDDHSRDSYPDAAEVFDLLDNDCDGVVDEQTDGFDDDGDGITEDAGDCNDYNTQVFPGAPERSDYIDNDCDSRVDEGTSLYDNDGDGFAYVDNDCDDTNPEISPSATEVCDGVDNDCDRLLDSADACISTDSVPVVIGLPQSAQNACMEGEILPFSVKVFDADGQTSIFQWGDDKNTGGFDNTSAQTVNWKCPSLPEGSGGGIYTVYALVTDPDGQQDWGDIRVSVYPDDYGLYEAYETTVVKEVKTCSSNPAAAGALASLGALVATLRRRRS